jgi:hypothetical protein
MTFQIISKHGHVELYINGAFYCSADTVSEAVEEYNKYVKRRLYNENKSS